MKVPLSKEEKRQIGRPSSPRWEIEIVAYRPSENKVLAVECKSYLDSPGVNLADLKGGRYADRYKLFTEPLLRDVVLTCLAKHMVDSGLCVELPRIQLAMAVGRISGEANELRAFFSSSGWELFDPVWIRRQLKRISDGAYMNSVASMVAKLLLRETQEVRDAG